MAQMMQSLYNAGVSQLSRMSRIEEVCNTKDEDSLPVYTLMELSQECSKNPRDASAIAELLLKKVASANPVIKYKALRAIKYIAEKATTAYFKKACGGTASGPIREAVKFSGPQDPILGNALNVRVREAAQACLDEVFRLTAPGAAAPSNPELQGRIKGYGSTTNNTIISPTTNPSKYQGFGNPAFEGPSASAAGSSTSSQLQPIRALNDYAMSLITSSPAAEAYAPIQSSSASPAPGLPPVQELPATRGPASALVGDAAAVVAEICAASGLRAQPHPDQLKAFVDRVSILDPDVVAVELTSYLDPAAPWQGAVRALCALEAVGAAAALPDADATIAALAGVFRATPDPVRACLSHVQPSVRPRAAKCLAALGVTVADDAGGGAPGVASGATAVPDLLGGLEDETTAPASAPAAQADPLADLLGSPPGAAPAANGIKAPEPAGAAADLFSGMTMAPAAGANGAATEDMFAGLTVNEAAPAPQPASDPLADLLHAPAPGGVGATPAAAPLPGAQPIDDLFANMAPPQASAPAAPERSSQPAARPLLDDLFSDGGASSAAAPAFGMHAPQATGYYTSGGVPGPNPLQQSYAAPNGGVSGYGAPQSMGHDPGAAAAQWMQQQPGMHPAMGQPWGHPSMQPGMPGPGMGAVYGQQAPQGAGNWYGMQQYGMQPGPGLQQPGVPLQWQQPGMPQIYGQAGAGMGTPQSAQPGQMFGMQGAGPPDAGAPPIQHSFSGQLRGITKTKDAFDFVNDEIKRK